MRFPSNKVARELREFGQVGTTLGLGLRFPLLSSSVSQISPLRTGWSMVRSIVATPPPRPHGKGSVDHSALAGILRSLATDGDQRLPDLDGDLAMYVASLATVDPDQLGVSEALVYWINLYNAGALRLAADAQKAGEHTVLRVPGAFQQPFVNVAGRPLSLHSIENGKVRRFKDPRIHAALVCGSVSCPTLRAEPYTGIGVDAQLDDQIRHFLTAGAAIRSDDDQLLLSRVFAWYGADFVRPRRMPALLPASRSAIREALTRWLPTELADWAGRAKPKVVFMEYDWSLRCSVG
ncbi:MAG: DUF547 domain-containing protein [Acidimicrobiia bacterium]|nr:DUF547 domain-containing protein [Acidimicrobiia bacterium]